MKKILAIELIIILIVGILGVPAKALETSDLKPASVSTTTRTVTVGEEVVITVSLGQAVKTAQFTLNYDSSKLQYSSKTGPGKFNKGNYGYYSDDLSSVTFKFKALKEGTAQVSASSVLISKENLKRVPISASGTSVTINAKATPTPPEETTPPNPSNPGNQGGTQTPSNPNTGSNTGNNSSTGSKPNNNTGSNKPTSSNTNTNSKPATNDNDKNKEDESNKTTEKNEEQDKKEDESTDNETKEEETAPDELIKMDNTECKTLEDEEDNIMIKALPIAIPDEIVLEANIISEDNSSYEKIQNIMNDIDGKKTYFDIKLLKDNVEIQPNGYVTVFIPIPEGYNRERLELYYIDEESGTRRNPRRLLHIYNKSFFSIFFS